MMNRGNVLPLFSVTGGTLTTSGNNYLITSQGDVLLNGGTLNLNASTMTFASNWICTSGHFNAGTSR